MHAYEPPQHVTLYDAFISDAMSSCFPVHTLIESILQLIPPASRLYSEPGSSSRFREENTYMHFRDLLDDLEAGGM